MGRYTSRQKTLEQKDEARTRKEFEKDKFQARRAIESLATVVVKMRVPKITAKSGVFPCHIFEELPDQQPDQNILFVKVPMEIHQMVWSYLVEQHDRFAFALTCKSAMWMYKERQKAYDKIKIKHYQKEHRLAVMIQMNSWMASDLRLCFGCVRFRSRKQTGDGDWGGNRAMVDMKYVEKGRVVKAPMIAGPRCPQCKYRDDAEQGEHTKFIKGLKDTVFQRLLDLE